MSDRLDPREFPYRADLAADWLDGKVEAERFVAGEDFAVARGLVSVREAPNAAARQSTELLHGERFTVYERRNGWAWGQNQTDGYVGYLLEDKLGEIGPAPTHEVVGLRSLLFPEPDLKTIPIDILHLTTRVTITDEDRGYARLAGGGWLWSRHLAPIDALEPDYIATARRFMGAPYVWGGRSSIGVDCSGLVQLSLARAGRTVPRDSDQQAAAVGTIVEDGVDAAEPGDLLYMKGHVVILSEPGRVLHAN
ncbi:MAG: C40 family peptidase, partial [Rhodospirillaceae bacterium]|nr:C40 family peptidase [Rhodospirillaceae bacterium]